jgi:large repetitive protein
MNRTSATTRAFTRIGALVVIVALMVSIAALPAAAGTPPSISGFFPSSGPVGTHVTINGANFTGAFQVAFNGHNAAFSVVNGTQITADVPSGANDGPISVTTPGGTTDSGNDFNVTFPGPPAVNNFNPDSGAVGATVHVYGANFTGATAVRFNGVSATPFTIVGPGNIMTTVPSGSTTGKISVTTPAGTGTSNANFTVTGPRIFSLVPNSGRVGTFVTINGSGFVNVSAVRFNGTSATFTVASGAKITTTVPSGATTGKITVITASGTATSDGNFTVTGPSIVSLSPNTGGVGTSVAINGSGFGSVSSVKFNGRSATFSFVSTTRVNAVVPNGATTGRVTLTTPAGTATSPVDFVVTGGVHTRSVSLALGRVSTRARLFATGNVSANDGYAACVRHVPVVIKRFHRGGWRWIVTTSTGENGSFRARLPNKRGRYRAKAPKIELVNGAVCAGRLSNVVRHHR